MSVSHTFAFEALCFAVMFGFRLLAFGMECALELSSSDPSCSHTALHGVRTSRLLRIMQTVVARCARELSHTSLSDLSCSRPDCYVDGCYTLDAAHYIEGCCAFGGVRIR